MADLYLWQYYETAANLGDTGESNPIKAQFAGLPDDALHGQEADPSPSNRCHERGRMVLFRRVWLQEGQGKSSTAVRCQSVLKLNPLNPANNRNGPEP